MHKHAYVILTAYLCFALAAFAVSPMDKAVLQAKKLMDQGDADGAMNVLKEAQVDHPDAPELRFGVGCAWFVKAEALTASGSAEEGRAAFAEARSLFNSLSQNADAKIAAEAAFNSANTTAREALIAAESGDAATAVPALRGAVAAYETQLERFPEHEGLRANLDHVRYKLKTLLQNSPPEQEQQNQKQPPEQQPTVVSRFGHAATDLPGAQTRVEENTAILVPPDKQEGQP